MKTSKSAKTRAESPKKTTKTFKGDKPEMKEKKIQTTPKSEKARSKSPEKPKKTARAESPKKVVAKSELKIKDDKVVKIAKDESKKVRAKQSSDKKVKEENKKDKLRDKSPSAKSSKSVDVKKNRAKADSAPKSRSKTVKFENEVKDKPKKIKKEKDEDVKMSEASNASKDKEFDINDYIEKPRPKKWLTPYMYFMNAKMQEIKGKQIATGQNREIMKKSAEEWRAMDDKQKTQFVKMSDKDKIRYEREVNENQEKGWFTNSDGVKSTDFKVMKPKFKPDVVQPKGVTTPYCAFMKENFSKISEELNEKGLQKVAPVISERWTKMTEAEKKPYYNLVEQDRERFDGELQQLYTQGFFINKKGQKSSDLKVKSKRKPAVELPQKRVASSEDAPATKKLKK